MEGKKGYIEHGSDEHAAFLMLRKATKDDKIVDRGWALSDETMVLEYSQREYGDKALRSILRQRVNELTNKPEVPENAPAMWIPHELEDSPSGIV